MDVKKLTTEEQNLVVDNESLVISFLKMMKNRGKIKENDWDDFKGDLYLKMCEAIRTYNSDVSKISTFMYTCFFHEHEKFIRRKVNKKDKEINFSEVSSYFVDDLLELYDDGFTFKANNEKIEKLMCLAHLSVRHKKIIRRYYIKNLELKTIGNELGLSRQRVSQILHASIDSMGRTCRQNNLSIEDFLMIDPYVDNEKPSKKMIKKNSYEAATHTKTKKIT